MKILQKEMKEVSTNIGFICDSCEEIISKNSIRTDNFSIDYTCGYGTEYDNTRIIADICDKCLIDIIKREVPKAKIESW